MPKRAAWKDYPCPTCGQPIGKPCVLKDVKFQGAVMLALRTHESRRKLAKGAA